MYLKIRKLSQDINNLDNFNDEATSQNISSPSLISKSTIDELSTSKSELEEKVSTLLSQRFHLLQQLEESMSELKVSQAKLVLIFH